MLERVTPFVQLMRASTFCHACACSSAGLQNVSTMHTCARSKYGGALQINHIGPDWVRGSNGGMGLEENQMVGTASLIRVSGALVSTVYGNTLIYACIRGYGAGGESDGRDCITYYGE